MQCKCIYTYVYICTLFLTVSPDDVVISATSGGSAVTGQRYEITCTVQYPEGLSSPSINWYGPDGSVSSGEGILVGATLSQQTNATSTLTFAPFRTVHSGRYSCSVDITSQSLPYNISKTANVDIIATGEAD